MQADVRRSGSRFVTRTDRVESRHSFSFGPHYDPENTRFGALIAHNDDTLSPGGGFDLHPHRGIDIVTWVVEGALAHSDDAGGSGVVRPGIVQRLCTGRGVRHAEVNASAGPTRYVQMWVMPDGDGADGDGAGGDRADGGGSPDYAIADVTAALADGRFAVIASGVVAAPLRLRCRATFFAARVNGSAAVPDGSLAHLFVATGFVVLDGETLHAGDAARITDAAGLFVRGDADVLAWLLA